MVRGPGGAGLSLHTGLTIRIANLFSRWKLEPQDKIRERVTKEMVDRHPPRFATLVGLGYPMLARDDGLNNPYCHGAFDANRFSVNG